MTNLGFPLSSKKRPSDPVTHIRLQARHPDQCYFSQAVQSNHHHQLVDHDPERVTEFLFDILVPFLI